MSTGSDGLTILLTMFLAIMAICIGPNFEVTIPKMITDQQYLHLLLHAFVVFLVQDPLW